MDYKLSIDGKKVSDSVQSFMLLLRFDVKQGDNSLHFGPGFFAFQITQEGMPTHEKLPGKRSKYEISGTAGIGGFSMDNLLPKMTLESEVFSESSLLHLAEFDSTTDPQTWLNTATWKEKNQLKAIVDKLDGTDNRNFHRGKLGTGELRYCSHIQAVSSGKTTEELVICAPFAENPFTGTLVANASYAKAGRVAYMPTLGLETKYNERPAEAKAGTQAVSSKASAKTSATAPAAGAEKGKWTHFPETKSEGIPGPVQGYAMVAQGAICNIFLNDFDGWLVDPAITAEKLFPRIKNLAQGFADTSRRLDNLYDVTIKNSVKLTATQMAPTEVLYFKGLNSVHPVFSA